jgi:hypothetical protein
VLLKLRAPEIARMMRIAEAMGWLATKTAKGFMLRKNLGPDAKIMTLIFEKTNDRRLLFLEDAIKYDYAPRTCHFVPKTPMKRTCCNKTVILPACSMVKLSGIMDVLVNPRPFMVNKNFKGKRKSRSQELEMRYA